MKSVPRGAKMLSAARNASLGRGTQVTASDMVDSAALRAAAVGAAAAACGAAVGVWLARRRRPAWLSGRFVRIDYASLPRCPLALLTEWIDAAEVRNEAP